jgi:hypothetical protein
MKKEAVPLEEPATADPDGKSEIVKVVTLFSYRLRSIRQDDLQDTRKADSFKVRLRIFSLISSVSFFTHVGTTHICSCF